MSNILNEHLSSMPVIAILRGVTTDSVIDIASAILDAGITVIEVPLNSPNAVDSIALLDKHLHARGLFGCGTCVDLASAMAVAKAGAKIMVTPNTDPEIISYAITQGMTPIPGWASVTEAFAAYHAGARFLKLFPASTYGVEHIKAARAVLPKDAHILAVGGVGADNARQWFKAGVAGLGIGSELYKAGMSAQEVSQRARAITATINGIERGQHGNQASDTTMKTPMSNSIKLVKTLELDNELGEGVVWDQRRQCIWWTDIPQFTLYQYTLDSQKLERFSTPERLGCLTPVANDERLLCAFESGFAFFDPRSGEKQWIKKLEEDNPGTRFNDGKTDRHGRFWVGTMVEDRDKATYKGRLYCVNNDLSISEHLSDLSITNSLCWSPDGHFAYHTDTPSRKIYRYASTLPPAAPSLSKPTLLVKTERGVFPDGSCVDHEGFVWNAQWAGSQVVRYSPQGEQNLVLPIPASQPSCPAFVGPDLSLLAVTSAYSDLNAEQRANDPSAGYLFIYQTPFQGLADEPFVLRA